MADPGRTALSIRELPARGILNLRGRPTQTPFTDGVRLVTGLDLPAPNVRAESEALSLIGLGPDEWLLESAAGTEPDWAARLRDAFGTTFAAVTDVSSGYATLEITGRDAHALLARGCLVDLHPRVFTAGSCAQTLLAKAGVIVIKRDDAPTFEVMVRRSLARYLWNWLNDAARDVGLMS